MADQTESAYTDVRDLQKNLADHCDLGDLKNLCFAMRIDHDNYPGTKREFILELLRDLENQGRVDEFIATLNRETPWVLGTAARFPPYVRTRDRIPYIILVAALLMVLASLVGGVAIVYRLLQGGAVGTATALSPTMSMAISAFTVMPSNTPTPPSTLTPNLTRVPTTTPTPTPPSVTPTLAVGFGRIVFATDRDGLAHLYQANGDGTNLRRLTEGYFYDWEPVWSPDGKQILFVSNREGPGTDGLYMMNADGTRVIRLSPKGGRDDTPAWLPGGQRILFSSNRSGEWDIYEMNRDGTGRKRITDDSSMDWYPVPSPDGLKIAFVSDREGSQELYVMDRDGQGVRRLTNMPGKEIKSIDWSPDGKWIAFQTWFSESDNRIYMVRPDGTDLALIAEKSGYPSWLPNSRQLIFDSDRNGIGKIYIMDIKSADIQQVTFGDGWDWSAAYCCALPTPPPTATPRPTATPTPTRHHLNPD